MTREQQQKLIKECFEERMEIMRKKGEDYDNGQDVLSNFKGAGANIGVTAEMQILSLIATKVARLGVLLNSNNPPENESIADSIKDLANYTDLLYCAVNEGNAKSEEIVDTKVTLPLPKDMWRYYTIDGLRPAFNPYNSVIGNDKGDEKVVQKSIITKMMESDANDSLYDIPHKYPTAYHKAYAERQGKC